MIDVSSIIQLPIDVINTLRLSRVVGISGSREVVPDTCMDTCGWLATRKNVIIAVGDARGVDTACRLAIRGYVPFNVEDYPGGSIRSRLARRSQACVRFVAGSDAALWVSFPAGACPAECVPSRYWPKGGSGSWSSLAMAIGLGCPVIMWLPEGIVAPWRRFACLGGGWWYAASGSLFYSVY